MVTNTLRAECKKMHFTHLGLVCAAFYAAVALVYLLAHDGTWVSVSAPDGQGWWGFLPDPTSDLVYAASDYPLGEAIVCASVAHTVFFPILALVFIHQFYFTDLQGPGAQMAFARGISQLGFFGTKLAVSTVVLQGCYLLFSVATAATYLAVYQPASAAAVIGALVGKLLLNCLVNESFIVFCMAVFSWAGNGPAAAGLIFVTTIVGLVAQLSMGGIDLPAHMGYWAKASGFDTAPEAAVSTAIFSIASFAVLAAAAYGGMLRARRPQ